MERPVRVFFSYSPEDQAFQCQLEKHLKQLERDGHINSWYAHQINPGDNYAEQIAQNLNEAEIILVLISPDFLASDYHHDVELTRALEKHAEKTALVIPIILRHSDWQFSKLKDLSPLPTDGKPIATWEQPDEVWLDIAHELRKIVDSTYIRINRVPLWRSIMAIFAGVIIFLMGVVMGVYGLVLWSELLFSSPMNSHYENGKILYWLLSTIGLSAVSGFLVALLVGSRTTRTASAWLSPLLLSVILPMSTINFAYGEVMLHRSAQAIVDLLLVFLSSLVLSSMKKIKPRSDFTRILKGFSVLLLLTEGILLPGVYGTLWFLNWQGAINKRTVDNSSMLEAFIFFAAMLAIAASIRECVRAPPVR